MRTKANSRRNSLPVILLGALLLLLRLTVPISADDGDEPQPKFEFGSAETLAVDAQQGAEFDLLNTTTLSYTVSLALTDFGFEAADDDAPQQVLWITNAAGKQVDSVPMAPGGSAKLHIAVDPAEVARVKPGTYHGYVTAMTTQSEGHVVRRALALTVPDSQKAPEPLVDIWTTGAIRWVPWLTRPMCRTGCALPLDLSTDAPVSMGGAKIGTLVGKRGELVAVSRVATKTLVGDSLGLQMDFEGLNHVGTYEGTVDLLPADEDKGEVTLTLNATDFLLWPLLVLALGIGIAIAAQQYVGVHRKIWKLQEREAKLMGKTYEEADEGFHASLEEKISDSTLCKHLEAYDIEDDLKERSDRLRQQIESLRHVTTPTLSEENEDYQTVQEALDFVEAQLKAWGTFGDRLAALQTALDEFAQTVPDEQPKWPDRDQENPVFYATAQAYLEGEALGLDAFAVLCDKVHKATTQAEHWHTLEAEVQDYRKYIATLMDYLEPEGIPEAYRSDLYEADRIINRAWGALWEAEDADDFKARAAEEDIARAEGLLLGLHDYVHRYHEPTVRVKSRGVTKAARGAEEREELAIPSTSGRRGLAGLREFLGSIGAPVSLPADHRLRAVYTRQARRRRDIAMAGLAFVVAVMTGLTTLYFGKNFGTWQDYFGALSWGIGTPAVDLLEHLVGAGEEGSVAAATRLVSQSLSEMGFAHASRAAEQHVPFLADVRAGGQVEDLLSVDMGVEGEVEPFQRLGGVDRRPADAQGQLFLSPAFHLILQQSSQELNVGPLPIDGLLIADVEGLQDA